MKSIPTTGDMTFLEDRQARWAAQCEKVRQEIIALGYRVISCVSLYDPRDHTRLRAMYYGEETRRVVITNTPNDPARFGINNVLVGPDSEVVDGYEGRAAGPNDVHLVVFQDAKVRNP